MKYPLPTILFFILIFMTFQISVLSISKYFSLTEVPNNSNTIINILLYVVIITILFFAFAKMKEGTIIKFWMLSSYFIAAAIPFYIIFNSIWVGLLISGIILYARWKFKNLYLHDLGEFITYLGVSALLVPLFNPFYAVILLVVFAIYDIISVFVTGHMIKLVKETKKAGVIPAILFQYKGEGSLLGGGDMIFPSIFSSVLWIFGFHTQAIFSVIGSTTGLLFLMLIGKRKKPYPALPSIVSFEFLFTLISVI